MESTRIDDTILFPFNWVTWTQGGFGPSVLDRATAKGMAALALKTLAKRALQQGEERKRPKCWYVPVESYDEAELAVRFTLSKPITAAVTPGHAELFEWACDAADRFRPLSKDEEALVQRRSKGLPLIFPQS